MKLTPYQEQFQKSLAGESAEQFTQIQQLADSSKDVASFKGQFDKAIQDAIGGAKTLEDAFDKLCRVVSWGETTYNPPVKPVAPKMQVKGAAVKPAVKPAVTPKPAEGEAVAPKRRGNPEALKKAREARGVVDPAAKQAETKAILDATVVALKAGEVPVKELCDTVEKAVAGKGANGASPSLATVYNVITNTGKDVDNSPFVATTINKRNRGYKLKA